MALRRKIEENLAKLGDTGLFNRTTALTCSSITRQSGGKGLRPSRKASGWSSKSKKALRDLKQRTCVSSRPGPDPSNSTFSPGEAALA